MQDRDKVEAPLLSSPQQASQQLQQAQDTAVLPVGSPVNGISPKQLVTVTSPHPARDPTPSPVAPTPQALAQGTPLLKEPQDAG
jgi:hypothetical protein